MAKQTIQFSLKFIIYAALLLSVATGQASTGLALCVAEPGHVEIEYSGSDCCEPTLPISRETGGLGEADAADCGPCRDIEIGNLSVLRSGSHSALSYSPHYNIDAGQFIAPNVPGTAPVLFSNEKMPGPIPLPHSSPELSPSPLRC